MRIAVDTNVLVRFLTWDNAEQATQAASAIETADAVILSTIVLCETVWVLRRAYRLPNREIASTLRELIESRTVELDRPVAEAGLALLERGGDFADGVLVLDADRAKADRLLTFDQQLIDLAGSERVQHPGD